MLNCAACDCVLADGTHVCASCASQRTARATAEVFDVPRPVAKLTLRDRSGERPGQVFVPVTVAPVLAQGSEARCVQHPKAAAIATCDTCHGLMCATCMFEVPGGLHLCPGCAMKARNPLTPGRLWSALISLLLAVVGTAGFVVVMTGSLASVVGSEDNVIAIGLLIFLVWFLLPLVGMALGFGAMDKKLGNPPLLWIAALANLLLVGSFVGMSVVGG